MNNLNKKYLLIQLIEQLEDEKVDSLINVVKGMVSPSSNEEQLNQEDLASSTPSVREVNNAQYIITQNINDSFN